MQLIQPTIDEIDVIVQTEHPKILAQMAEELFANQGNFNNRSSWADNTPSTVKRKGGNSPNIDTGFLEHSMSTAGFLENDNWLDNIIPPKKNGDYKYADKLRKFSDIGKTAADLKYMDTQLEKKIQDGITS